MGLRNRLSDHHFMYHIRMTLSMSIVESSSQPGILGMSTATFVIMREPGFRMGALASSQVFSGGMSGSTDTMPDLTPRLAKV